VPVSPESPGDIVPPVEIGNSREHSNVTSPGELSEVNTDYINVVAENKAVPEHMEEVPENAEYRVELP
jgi:hypothetical protein